MNRRKPMTSRQLAREKLAFRYSSALERGDFEIINAVLREAENDPVLERMLHEINDVYRAELAPPIALPSFSANHNHRNRREDATMTVTYPSIRRVPMPAASRGRWSSTATLAAAIIAIILFVTVLIARRPPNQPEQANSGISSQNKTATPFVMTVTPSGTPTLTPTANVSCTQPGAQLDMPFDGMQVTQPIDVAGIATAENFAFYRFEINNTQSGSGFTVVHESDQAMPDHGVLGQFDPASYGSGEYEFRLVVFDTSNVLQAACMVTISIIGGSATPTAISQQPVDITATPVQDAGIIFATPPQVPVLCQGIVSSNGSVDGVNVFADSDSNSVYMGRIALGTAVDILDARDSSTGGWYYVRAETGWGWMSAEFVLLTAPCAYPDGQPWTSYPCGTNLVNVLTPTLIPTQGEPLDAPYLTATAIVVQATALTPTTIPPCSTGAQATAFVPYPTPTAVFDLALRSGGYDLITTEQVGDIPANARVRINSAQFDGSQWSYDVVAKDGQTRGLAYDYQLAYVPGVTPGAATPTAIFGSAIGTGFYSAITTQPIGDIPAGSKVQIYSAWYNGSEWMYQIYDENGNFSDNARESQLAVAPGYEPGMPTPTAAFFDHGNLVTLEQVGDIPAGTLVQTTSGYFDGTQWVYTIATLDGVLYAEARDSQLRYATEGDYGPGPTPPPTETATPTLVQ